MKTDESKERDDFLEDTGEDLELQDEAAKAVTGGAPNVVKTGNAASTALIGNIKG